MRKISIICVGLLAIGLTGCAKKVRSPDENNQFGEYGAGDSMQFYGSNTEGAEGGEMPDGVAKNTYYFDYDRYEISDQDTLSLMSQAQRIAGNPNRHVRIEGHTDERGSREYNIALGERRAKAIAQALKMKGVANNQISVVSYGKEKPAAQGHGEPAWHLNRRGVIADE